MVSSSIAHGPLAETDRGELIHRAWDLALFEGDAAALTALYAPDALLESPLALVLMELDRPLSGRAEILTFFDKVVRSGPLTHRHHRVRHAADGKRFVWEYPRETPAGEQMDAVEVIELDADGLIKSHRVYWGWFAIHLRELA